jgi:hypothetical protein
LFWCRRASRSERSRQPAVMRGADAHSVRRRYELHTQRQPSLKDGKQTMRVAFTRLFAHVVDAC